MAGRFGKTMSEGMNYCAASLHTPLLTLLSVCFLTCATKFWTFLLLFLFFMPKVLSSTIFWTFFCAVLELAAPPFFGIVTGLCSPLSLVLRNNGRKKEENKHSQGKKEMESGKYDYEAVVLFDGVCAVCNTLVNFVIDRDPKGRVAFAPLQSDKGLELLEKHHIKPDLDTMVGPFEHKNVPP